MIPIQCPKCGRTGNVPPDRLNARLTCKGCQSAFHMDAGGRMILGGPNDPASRKRANARATSSGVNLDLGQAWRKIPRAAKMALPLAVVLIGGLVFVVSGRSFGPDYQERAEIIGRALLRGDKDEVMNSATSQSAPAAGRWYDLTRPLIAAKGGGSAAAEDVKTDLLNGNPDRDSTINVNLVVSSNNVSTNVLLQMVYDGGHWKIDGTRTLGDAQQALESLKLAKKK